MSEFTKDELIKIKNGLSWWSESCCSESNILLRKIHNMIDNYCEHNFLQVSRIKWYVCSQCGTPFNLKKNEHVECRVFK